VNNEETGGVRWKRSELLNRKHLNKKTPFFVEKSLCELILRKTVFLLNFFQRHLMAHFAKGGKPGF
jgi:hypothetical protein